MADTILLTGGTGFVGTIIGRNLMTQGFEVKTLGRSTQNDISCNISNTIPHFDACFDIVIHNAGKAHVVPTSALERKEFVDVNVVGTKNLLLGLQSLQSKPSSFVFISTIAVYGLTKGERISEDYPLEAQDPYGKTKIQAEKIISDWCEREKVQLTILRLPLIVGPNPPGNLGAMIRGVRKGLYVSIDGGKARKSMVLAEDIGTFLPIAAKYPGVYNLSDGYHPSFGELESLIARQAGVGLPPSIPFRMAKLLGIVGDVVDKIVPGKVPVTSNKIEKLVSTLTFDDGRARRIGWKPRQVLEHFRISK